MEAHLRRYKWFSFLALLAWGVAVASSARAEPAASLLDPPLGRNEVELTPTLGEHTLEWAPAYCRPHLIRLRPLSRTVLLEQVRVIYTSRRAQVLRPFSWHLSPQQPSLWMQLESDPREGSAPCIDRVEIIGRSLGGPSRLRVEWR